jgi:hypothetical protein
MCYFAAETASRHLYAVVLSVLASVLAEEELQSGTHDSFSRRTTPFLASGRRADKPLLLTTKLEFG